MKLPTVDQTVQAIIEGQFIPIRANERLWDEYNGAEPNDRVWLSGDSDVPIWISEDMGLMAEGYGDDTNAIVGKIQGSEWVIEPV